MGDDFEEVDEEALRSNLQAPEPVEPLEPAVAAVAAVAAAPKEPTKKKEAEAEPEPKGVSAIGRSAKQQVIDKARAEKLAELQKTYEREFANITSGRPKPKAYNAAALLSAKDPAAKLKNILARDRAVYTAKQKRKGANVVAPTRKRNAPSILSETREAVAKIQRDAKAALLKLKTETEAELRSIGGNISILHSIFHHTKTRTPSKKSLSRSKRRTASAEKAAAVQNPLASLNPSGSVINQMSGNNN